MQLKYIIPIHLALNQSILVYMNYDVQAVQSLFLDHQIILELRTIAQIVINWRGAKDSIITQYIDRIQIHMALYEICTAKYPDMPCPFLVLQIAISNHFDSGVQWSIVEKNTLICNIYIFKYLFYCTCNKTLSTGPS